MEAWEHPIEKDIAKRRELELISQRSIISIPMFEKILRKDDIENHVVDFKSTLIAIVDWLRDLKQFEQKDMELRVVTKQDVLEIMTLWDNIKAELQRILTLKTTT